MQILLGNMGHVKPLPPPVCALLGGGFVFVAVHVWTTPPARTQPPYKINVVPNAGALAIAKVTISTIVNVTEGN